MNVFMIRNRQSGEYFQNGSYKSGKKITKWNIQKHARVWSSRSGPSQIMRLYELRGVAEIVTFELKEIKIED